MAPIKDHGSYGKCYFHFIYSYHPMLVFYLIALRIIPPSPYLPDANMMTLLGHLGGCSVCLPLAGDHVEACL
jgi:hypothetical protein